MGIWKFEDYTGSKGERALSIQLHIRDMPSPVGTLSFPPALRQQAARASVPLTEALADLGAALRVQRNLVSGQRLDPRKKRAVGVALRRGVVDANELRPYQRRESQPHLPRIAVVASAGVEEVNADPTYIGRITQLCLAIGWACETAGAEVTAHLCEGQSGLSPHQPYRTAVLGYTLLEQGRMTPLPAYNVALMRSLFYGEGFRNAYLADAKARQMAAALVGHQVGWAGAYLSNHGGAAVQWAREMHRAELVIAVGNITDAGASDIRLGTDFGVTEACAEIAKQARVLVHHNC